MMVQMPFRRTTRRDVQGVFRDIFLLFAAIYVIFACILQGAAAVFVPCGNVYLGAGNHIGPPLSRFKKTAANWGAQEALVSKACAKGGIRGAKETALRP